VRAGGGHHDVARTVVARGDALDVVVDRRIAPAVGVADRGGDVAGGVDLVEADSIGILDTAGGFGIAPLVGDAVASDGLVDREAEVEG
jgi:hypothetical protein